MCSFDFLLPVKKLIARRRFFVPIVKQCNYINQVKSGKRCCVIQGVEPYEKLFKAAS